MTISPRLQALLVLRDHNYIGEMGLPKYQGCHTGTHHFILQNGDRVQVDLVLNRVEGA
jgi:hypothetical protein